MIGPAQSPVSDNTQHTQETDMYALGGIENHNPSKRGATDPGAEVKTSKNLL
jgi:hypothetical protein